MGTIVRVFIAMLALAGAAQAGGERGGSKDGAFADAPFADRPHYYAKACYWHRGTRYCRLYCYVEINGNHHCQERESQAVPQGDPYRPVRPTVEDIYRRPRPY
jgi:hypothetical protein